MTLWIIAILVIALVFLGRLGLPTITWLAIWPVAVWIFIRYGVAVHVPVSLLQLYLAVTMVGAVVYIVADGERSRTVSGQLTNFLTNRSMTPLLGVVVLLLPVLLGWKIYRDANAEVRSPTFGRTVHPAPPDSIDFKGKQIDIRRSKNPFRELAKSDPEQFKKHLESGKKVYYTNCFYCHGDDMKGDGMFAHGLNPLPADFRSPATIGTMQESYLFWRIAKGGPGLPQEAGPWSSSMPAWEKFLSEDEIWDVILFLYDYTGSNPRAEEEHH